MAELLFGEALRQLRESRGLSRAALGQRLRQTSRYIWKLETGRKGFSVALFVDLAEALEISPAKLLRIVCRQRGKA